MKIAIIGAGPAGLSAGKTAIECGLEPEVFEKDDQIGGLWKPNGSVWENMRTNLSHYTCMFSDAPWDNPSGDFPNQSEVCDYLCRYASQNNLLGHIHFNSEVVKISRSKEKWKVKWRKDDIVHKKKFEFVIVCSGIFSEPYVPDIPGLETFTGQKLHSKEYRNPSAFNDKVVAVIGNSFSGTEVSAEISNLAAKTLHCASKAIWILPRYLPVTEGKRCPLDLVFYSRAAAERSSQKQVEEKNIETFEWFKNITKQEENVPELAVTTSPADPSFVAISDTYTEQVKEGKIELNRSRVREIKRDTLVFEDGTEATVDAIVFATGYTAALPFFKPSILEKLEFNPEDRFQPLILDRCTFSPHLPNIGFAGMYRGPFFGVIELQVRLICYVFSKKIPAPILSEMQEGIENERKIRDQDPRPQFPHGDYVIFADKLAKAAGVLPDFEALKESEPDLYEKLWKGPLNACHYRLNGYGANPELAMKVINKLN